MNCEQDWRVSGHCSISVVSSRNDLLRKSSQSILASKTFQQPGNSHGMLSQAWAAIRTILPLPMLGYITEGNTLEEFQER